MPRLAPPTHPRQLRQLSALGERLRAARLRRKLTQAMVAERVGVTLPTLRKLESGDPSTSLATVLRVLQVLGLSDDIDALAAHDAPGRQMQDAALKRPGGRRMVAGTVRPAEDAS
jgi:transcriptional regulator with XRE-family HTH domain